MVGSKHEKYIEDESTDFDITFEELDAELNLKEITDYICHLELEDEMEHNIKKNGLKN